MSPAIIQQFWTLHAHAPHFHSLLARDATPQQDSQLGGFDTTQIFSGHFDEVRIWNCVRTPQAQGRSAKVLQKSCRVAIVLGLAWGLCFPTYVILQCFSNFFLQRGDLEINIFLSERLQVPNQICSFILCINQNCKGSGLTLGVPETCLFPAFSGGFKDAKKMGIMTKVMKFGLNFCRNSTFPPGLGLILGVFKHFPPDFPGLFCLIC